MAGGAPHLGVIDSLRAENLDCALYSTEEHPIAKTKFDALDWNIKLTMWHLWAMGDFSKDRW